MILTFFCVLPSDKSMATPSAPLPDVLGPSESLLPPFPPIALIFEFCVAFVMVVFAIDPLSEIAVAVPPLPDFP